MAQKIEKRKAKRKAKAKHIKLEKTYKLIRAKAHMDFEVVNRRILAHQSPIEDA